jgi:deoxycytidylate deaminase
MKKVEMLTSLYNRACLNARKSGMNHRHGAIIVRHGEIVAEGYNYEVADYKTTFSVHAEMDALSKVKHLGKSFLAECDMMVVRIGPATLEHTSKLSMPCPNCRPKIEKLGIRKVYYTTNDEFDAAVIERFSNGSKILQYRNAAIHRSNRYKNYHDDPSYTEAALSQQQRQQSSQQAIMV